MTASEIIQKLKGLQRQDVCFEERHCSCCHPGITYPENDDMGDYVMWSDVEKIIKEHIGGGDKEAIEPGNRHIEVRTANSKPVDEQELAKDRKRLKKRYGNEK